MHHFLIHFSNALHLEVYPFLYLALNFNYALIFPMVPYEMFNIF